MGKNESNSSFNQGIKECSEILWRHIIIRRRNKEYSEILWNKNNIKTSFYIYIYILIKAEIGPWHTDCSTCTKQRA